MQMGFAFTLKLVPFVDQTDARNASTGEMLSLVCNMMCAK
jgi:hypothetical protein